MRYSTILILIICLFPSILFCQFSVRPEVSFGINQGKFIGLAGFGVVGIREIKPTHSYSIGLITEYKIKNITISTGISVLDQPIVFILDEYYAADHYSDVTITYDILRRHETYWFLDLPIWISKTYKSGISINGGVNFKFYQTNWRKLDFLLYHYEFKKCTTGLLLALGYNFENNLSLYLKTNIEYPGFIREEFFDEIHLVQNINTMLCLSYRFNLNKKEAN